MADEKIRIATSIPSLKDKIQTYIRDGSDVIYWYIRFNIALDENTVSEKTMGVTDTSGYIMRTDINYDDSKNTIIISPLDSYEQNRFYILRISKKVKSKKGQKLKSNINILFKLINNQISEFKVLKKEVKVVTPKKRPANYEQMHTRSRVYSIDGKIKESVTQDKLPYADLEVNVLPGIVGIILLIPAIILKIIPFIAVSVVICIAALIHILSQLSKKGMRSMRAYNKGARKFNKSQYAEAKALFIKALIQDEDNEYAEYAQGKVEYYLDADN